MGIKKVKNAIRNARANNEYLKYYDAPIDDKAILLEAAQGKHTDGNIFAFLRCVEENPRWQYLTPYVVITRESKAEAQKKQENTVSHCHIMSVYKITTNKVSDIR